MDDSFIGWEIGTLVSTADSRIGFVTATLQHEEPSGLGLRVYTAQGLQMATVLTWTANGWT